MRPPSKDFVYITDNTYSKDELFQMECNMLHLGFSWWELVAFLIRWDKMICHEKPILTIEYH